MSKLFDITSKFDVNAVGVGDLRGIKIGENMLEKGLVISAIGGLIATIGWAVTKLNSAWRGASDFDSAPDEVKDIIRRGHACFVVLDSKITENGGD